MSVSFCHLIFFFRSWHDLASVLRLTDLNDEHRYLFPLKQTWQVMMLREGRASPTSITLTCVKIIYNMHMIITYSPVPFPTAFSDTSGPRGSYSSFLSSVKKMTEDRQRHLLISCSSAVRWRFRILGGLSAAGGQLDSSLTESQSEGIFHIMSEPTTVAYCVCSSWASSCDSSMGVTSIISFIQPFKGGTHLPLRLPLPPLQRRGGIASPTIPLPRGKKEE